MLATPPRHEGGSRSRRRRDGTQMQRPAGLRTASTQPRCRPSGEGRLGALCEPGLARRRATGVTRLASSRPAWTAGWHLVRCLRVHRGALSMRVMLRSTEVDPHVTPATPRPSRGRVSCASPRDTGHRDGDSGLTRSSQAPRLRSLVACSPRVVVVPRLRSPDRPGVPFSNDALPLPGDPSPPTEVGVDLRWTRALRPSRVASRERLRRLRRPSPTSEPPEERPTPGLCSADESVTFPARFRTTNALSFHGLLFPYKASHGPLPGRRGRLPRSRRSDARGRDMNVPAPAPGPRACRTSHPSLGSPMPRAAPRPKSRRCLGSLSGPEVARPAWFFC